MDRASYFLTRDIIDKLSYSFKKAIWSRDANPIILANRNNCIMHAAFDVGRKVITPAKWHPLSVWRFSISILCDCKVVKPLKWAIWLLICHYFMFILEAIEISPCTIIESKWTPFPCVGFKVAPLAIYPTLSSNIDSPVGSWFIHIWKLSWYHQTWKWIVKTDIPRKSFLDESLFVVYSIFCPHNLLSS